MSVNIQFNFPLNEAILSPQTVVVSTSDFVHETNDIINTEIGSTLPSSNPQLYRFSCLYGTNTPYNVELTWGQVTSGSLEDPFPVTVINQPGVTAAIVYDPNGSGSTASGNTLPILPSNLTIGQMLSAFLELNNVSSGSTDNMSVQPPQVLSNDQLLSSFASGGDTSEPLVMGMTITDGMTVVEVNVFRYQDGGTGQGTTSLDFIGPFNIFQNWTIQSVIYQYQVQEGLLATSDHTVMYLFGTSGNTSESELGATVSGSTTLVSLVDENGILNLIAHDSVLTQVNLVAGFWALTPDEPLEVTVPLGCSVVELVDKTQQYPFTMLGITSSVAVNMSPFDLALSELPDPLNDDPIVDLPLLNMLAAVPDDQSVTYVIQDITPLLAKVTLFWVDLGVTSEPSQLKQMVVRLAESVTWLIPNPGAEYISGHSSGEPHILDPLVTVSSFVDEDTREAYFYLTQRPPADAVGIQLPTGTQLTLHEIPLETTLSELLDMVQIAVGSDFDVWQDTTLWYGVTGITGPTATILSDFDQYTFNLRWVEVEVINLLVSGSSAWIPVPRISSPSTTLLTLIGLSIPVFHFIDPIVQDYYVSIQGVLQTNTDPLYPLAGSTTTPTTQFQIIPAYFSGRPTMWVTFVIAGVSLALSVIFGTVSRWYI